MLFAPLRVPSNKVSCRPYCKLGYVICFGKLRGLWWSWLLIIKRSSWHSWFQDIFRVSTPKLIKGSKLYIKANFFGVWVNVFFLQKCFWIKEIRRFTVNYVLVLLHINQHIYRLYSRISRPAYKSKWTFFVQNLTKI